jgi:catechol 2,3-dioxygenase-like lactoylglutathione lyase family enzyme
MRLNHLALAVRDRDASRRFYETYFGFVVEAQEYDDGVLIIRNEDGFDLALGPRREDGRLPRFVHFGFDATGPEQVHGFLDRLAADGIEIVERWDEPAYVSFKCLDPDGYVIEVSWEPS